MAQWRRPASRSAAGRRRDLLDRARPSPFVPGGSGRYCRVWVFRRLRRALSVPIPTRAVQFGSKTSSKKAPLFFCRSLEKVFRARPVWPRVQGCGIIRASVGNCDLSAAFVCAAGRSAAPRSDPCAPITDIPALAQERKGSIASCSPSAERRYTAEVVRGARLQVMVIDSDQCTFGCDDFIFRASVRSGERPHR